VLITIGSRVPYAATHEYGDPSRNIPRRSYLRPALDDETDTIRQIIDDGVSKALRIALSE
jgi:phage gpG-like protein